MQSKIKRIDSPGNAVFGKRIAFKDQFPVSAPEQGPEMDLSETLIRIPRINGKKRNSRMTAETGSAFQHEFSLKHLCSIYPVFLSPLPLKSCQTRSVSARQNPNCGKKGLKAEFVFPVVDDFYISADQIEVRMQEIVQIGSDSEFAVSHCHNQMVRIFQLAALIQQFHRTVGRMQFQTGNRKIA